MLLPDSAATAAGVQRSDIIRMLNDQQIVNPDQLGTLIRSFPDGANITLTLLRKGQEVEVERQAGEERADRGPRAGRVRTPMEMGRSRRMDFDFDVPDMATVREAVARAKAEAMRAGDEARRAAQRLRVVTTDGREANRPGSTLAERRSLSPMTKGELKMETVNGKKMLSAKDAQGNVLFNGPIDTEEQRAQLPPEVRKRFEKLENQELPEIPRKRPNRPSRRNHPMPTNRPI